MTNLLIPSTSIQTAIVTITPEIAQNLLDNTDMSIQRKANKRQVKFLASEMTKGDWSLNGDAIRQDIDGNIIDGQHRLLACIQSQIPIKTLYVKGLPKSSIVTIDMGGRGRSHADILEMTTGKKYKNSSAISAVVKFIYALDKNIYDVQGGSKGKNSYMSSSDFLIWIENNQDIFDSVNNSIEIRSKGDKLIPVRIFCGLKYKFDKLNLEKSNLFFQQLSDGVGLMPTDTLYTLRKKIISHTSNRLRLTTKELVLLLCRCWNAFIKGENITKLYIPSSMPKLKS